MATLEKIRNRAGLLVIAIGLALLAFLLGDILQQGSTLFRDNQLTAMSIDGDVVKIDDYNLRVDQAQEMYRMQTGNANPSETEMAQIRNQVFQTIVAEHTLDAETEKLGLSVSPAEVLDLVQGDFVSPVVINSPLFANPETGVFDRGAVINLLKAIDSKAIAAAAPEQRPMLEQYRTMWVNLESQARDYRLSEKYTNLIAKAIVANDLEVDAEAKGASEVADFAYVAQLSTLLPDSIVAADEAAIKRFYDQNKELFKTEESREVDVVYTTIHPSQEDIELAKQDAEAARKELVEGHNPEDVVSEYSDEEMINGFAPLSLFRNAYFPSFLADAIANAEVGTVTDINYTDNTYSVAKLLDTKVAPDSLFVRAIILDKASSSVADSLFNVVKAAPDRFSEIAAEYSLNERAAATGGEMGWVTEIAAGDEYRDVLFGATVGVPVRHSSARVEQIFLIEKATAPVRKYKVALVTKKATASSRTITNIYNEFNSFLAKNKSVAALDTAAIAAGYQMMRGQQVYGMQPIITTGVENSRELVRWAFENKQGAISDIKECGDKFALVILKKITERGYLPLSEARAQIEPYIANKAKVDKLYNELTAGNYASLEAYATAINAEVDSVQFVKFDSSRIEGLGFEPALNAVAAFAPLNKPVAVKGNNGVYYVQVYNRNIDAEAASAESVRATINAARQNSIRMRALQALVRRADVVDTRARFF